MPLGTLDRTPPPFFKQGPSALSKLMVFSALAVFLMVADARFKVSQPLRAAVSVVLQPLQWLAMQPVQAARSAAGYFVSLDSARAERDTTQRQMVQQTQRASQVEQLALENARLRQLLALRERNHADGRAAEVLYDAADPFTRKVVIDAGLAQGVSHGSPVVDELGVVGQVTRVHPLVSEVTLLSDRDQAIPVLNTRTGVRGVAYGDPSFPGGALELRFMPASADVQVGDLLTTSGVDGVYPPGLHVARIAKVERRADSAFSRIHCTPQALIHGTRHVLVLKPLSGQLPPPPTPDTAGPGQKGHRK